MTWSCPACTYLNAERACCEMCETPRPDAAPTFGSNGFELGWRTPSSNAQAQPTLRIADRRSEQTARFGIMRSPSQLTQRIRSRVAEERNTPAQSSTAERAAQRSDSTPDSMGAAGWFQQLLEETIRSQCALTPVESSLSAAEQAALLGNLSAPVPAAWPRLRQQVQAESAKMKKILELLEASPAKRDPSGIVHRTPVQATAIARLTQLVQQDPESLKDSTLREKWLKDSATWIPAAIEVLSQQLPSKPPAPPPVERQQTAEETCSVCLGPIEGRTVTKCGHAFCKGCIEAVLRTQQPANQAQAPCPLCRTIVKTSELTYGKSSSKPAASDSKSYLQVIRPPNVKVGDQLIVQGPNGARYACRVPDGIATGVAFHVAIPAIAA